MFGRERAWLRDLAHVSTIVSALVVLGVGTVLGVVFQAVLAALFTLSVVERVLLGGGAFLIVLAVILAGLKAIFRQQPQDTNTQALTGPSSEYSLWQELKRVEAENQQLRDALQQSEEQNEKLRKWIGSLEPAMWRLNLKWGLEFIGRMGQNLSEKEQPDAKAMERWVSLTSGLIRKHYDDETADYFLVHEDDASFAGRLGRLQEVANKAVDFEDMPMPSKFDIDEALEPYPEEWRNYYRV